MNTAPFRRLAALSLVLLGTCALPAHASEGEEEFTPEEGAIAVLAMINETDLTDTQARTELVGRLATTESSRRLALIHAYAAVAGHSIEHTRSDLLDDVFDRMGQSAMSRLLLDATRKDSESIERTVALRILRERPVVNGMQVVLSAAASEPPEQLRRPYVQRALRESAAIMLERDPDSIEVMSASLYRLNPSAQDAFLDVIERQSPAVGTREMSRFLGGDERLNASVLPRLVRLPITQERPLIDQAEGHIAWSLQATDPDARRYAVHVIGRFHLTHYAEKLVERLEDQDPRVSAAARKSLIKMTGVKLLGRVDLWERRLASIQSWKDDRFDQYLARSRDPDAEIAIPALQELARHRFHRESIVPRLHEASISGDVKIRLAACQTLGALASPTSMSLLLARLDDGDPAVVAAASQALAAISGLKSPEDPGEWRKLLRARF